MNTPKKRKATTLDQEGIDRVVVSQASDESAWEAPFRVKRSEPAALSLPGEPAARAAFLAKPRSKRPTAKYEQSASSASFSP
jgi:hypothetical protein